MTTEIRVWIPDSLYDRYQAAKPDFLDQRSFLSLVIDQGLTALMSGITLPAYRVGAEGTTTSPSEVGFCSSTTPGDEEASTGDKEATPPEQGSKGESELIKGQLLKKGDSKEDKKDPFRFRKLDPDVIPCDLLDCQQLLPEFWSVKKGVRSEQVFNRICNKLRAWTPEQRREALERAISSGWGDVFEPKPQGSGPYGQKPLAQLAAEMEAMPRLW